MPTEEERRQRRRRQNADTPPNPSSRTGAQPTMGQPPRQTNDNPISPTPEARPTRNQGNAGIRVLGGSRERVAQQINRESDQAIGDRNQAANQRTDQRVQEQTQPQRDALAERQKRIQNILNRQRSRNEQVAEGTQAMRERGETFASGGSIDRGETHVIDPSREGAGERGGEIQRGGGEVRYSPAAPTEEVARIARGRGGLVGEPINRRRTPATEAEQNRARAFDQGASQAEVGEMPADELEQAREEREQMGLDPLEDEVLRQQWERSQRAQQARSTEGFQQAQAGVIQDRSARREQAMGIRDQEIARDRERRESVADARTQRRQDEILGLTPEARANIEIAEAATQGERRGTGAADIINVGGRAFDRRTREFVGEDEGGERDRETSPGGELSEREQVRIDSLQQGVESIDRLMASERWETMSPDQQETFTQQRQQYMDDLWSMTEGPSGGNEPSPEHIETLQQNPTEQRRRQFDEVYGEGAAARVLGE